MLVRLSDGGRLVSGRDGQIHRYDRRGRVIETLRPGDPGYSYWLSLLYARRQAK